MYINVTNSDDSILKDTNTLGGYFDEKKRQKNKWKKCSKFIQFFSSIFFSLHSSVIYFRSATKRMEKKRERRRTTRNKRETHQNHTRFDPFCRWMNAFFIFISCLCGAFRISILFIFFRLFSIFLVVFFHSVTFCFDSRFIAYLTRDDGRVFVLPSHWRNVSFKMKEIEKKVNVIFFLHFFNLVAFFCRHRLLLLFHFELGKKCRLLRLQDIIIFFRFLLFLFCSSTIRLHWRIFLA